MSLIGHSHVALFFSGPTATRTGTCAGRRRSTAPTLDLGEGRWLINPGSVGQPRDGDPRAAWLELDTERVDGHYHRVEYDIDQRREGDPRGRAAAAARRSPLRRSVGSSP